MSGEFSFRLTKTDGGARRGRCSTAHGVHPHAGVHAGRARLGTVKALYVDQVKGPAPTSFSAIPIT